MGQRQYAKCFRTSNDQQQRDCAGMIKKGRWKRSSKHQDAGNVYVQLGSYFEKKNHNMKQRKRRRINCSNLCKIERHC